MLSNQQIFGNKVYPIEFLNSPRRTGHDIFAMPNVTASIPFFFTFFVVAVLIFSDRLNRKLFKKIYGAGAENLGEIDERLENYFVALNYDSKEWIVEEEKLCRGKLNFKTLTDHAFDNLQDAFHTPAFLQGISQGVEQTKISGCFSYDILANPYYQQQFAYLPAMLPERKQLVIDGDYDESNNDMQSNMVRMILNLAYMDRKTQKSFKIDKGSYAKQLKNKFRRIFSKQYSSRIIDE